MIILPAGSNLFYGVVYFTIIPMYFSFSSHLPLRNHSPQGIFYRSISGKVKPFHTAVPLGLTVAQMVGMLLEYNVKC